jgi:hypothetical protein
MTKLKKWEEKKLTSSFLNRLAGVKTTKRSEGQKLIANLKLEEDEFTRHASTRQLTLEFLQSAVDFEYFYQGGKQKLVTEFASALEEDLKRRGEDELISKISSFIIKLIRQAGLKWSPIYLRRVLDDKYKDSISQANALKRKSKQPQLESKTVPEETRPYEVNTEIEAVIAYDSDDALLEDLLDTNKPKYARTMTIQANVNNYNRKSALEINLPVIIKVNPREHNATCELDKVALEARNRLELQEEEERKRKQEQSKPEPKSKEKKNKKSRGKPEDSKPTNPESESDNVCRQCFESGKITLIKQLRNGRQRMQCIHDNGTKHTWTRAKDLEEIVNDVLRTPTNSESKSDNICGQCFEVDTGKVSMVKRLRNGNVKMQCIHDNGTKHTWTILKNLEGVVNEVLRTPTNMHD